MDLLAYILRAKRASKDGMELLINRRDSPATRPPPRAEDEPQLRAMPHLEQLICHAEVRSEMDSAHGLVPSAP